MSFKYSLRFNLLPDFNVEERLERLISFCIKTGIDDVMFFIDAEDFNTGHITFEEAKPYVEVIKYAKLRLAEHQITTSLNPWVTFLHGDRGRKLKPGQDFDLMVSPIGEVASATVCRFPKTGKNISLSYTIIMQSKLNLRSYGLKMISGCIIMNP